MADEEARLKQREERRQNDRSRLIVDVFFDGKDATGIASTKDISLGGLYMNTQTAIPEGSLLLIRITFGPGEEVVSNARVIYSNPGLGVGVMFDQLSDAARSLLERELTNG
jgi:PilZ domain-containing protein